MWTAEKIASQESLAVAKEESVRYLTTERDRLLRLSHQEALDELVRMAGFNSRIEQVSAFSTARSSGRMVSGMYSDNSVHIADGIAAVKEVAESSVHLILSDIPYGIGAETWDVLHSNTNSALLGTSPAQAKAGAVFRGEASLLTDGRKPIERSPSSINGGVSRSRVPGSECSSLAVQHSSFAGRRLSHRCVVAFEDAGFTFKDSLAWLRERAAHRAQRLSVVYRRRGDTASAELWKGWRVGNLRPNIRTHSLVR